jgi:hypothetical protein
MRKYFLHLIQRRGQYRQILLQLSAGLSAGLQEATKTELRPAVAMVPLVMKSLLFIIVTLDTKNTMYGSKQKINIIMLPGLVFDGTCR